MILRGGVETVVSVNGLLAPGGQDLDVPLEPDDLVISPRLEEELIYLVGGFRRPGPIPYDEAPTLLKAIAHAGEDIDFQTVDLTRIVLVRDGQSSTLDIETLLYEGDLSHNIDLMPDDILIAPPNRDNFVYLVGEINTPGPLPYEKGMTLSEAMLKAGGPTENANIEQIRVTRVDVEQPYKFHVNYRQWVAHGDFANNPELKAGDVIRVPIRESIRVRNWLGNLGLVLQPLNLIEQTLSLFN